MKEEKENKQRYLSDIQKQTTEQGEKISRADKSLRKAQKDIQNLYVIKRDDVVLLQQVTENCRQKICGRRIAFFDDSVSKFHFSERGGTA